MPLKNVAQLRALKAKERRGEISSEKVREFIDATPRTKSGHLDIPRGPKRVRKSETSDKAKVAGGGTLIAGATAMNPVVDRVVNPGKRAVGQRVAAEGRRRAAEIKATPSPARNWRDVQRTNPGLSRKAARRQAAAPRTAALKRTGRLVNLGGRLARPVGFKGRVGTGVGLAALGVPTAWSGARNMVERRDERVRKKANEADYAATGALLAPAAWHGASYGAKPLVDKPLARKIKADPKHRKTLEAHRKATGVSGKQMGDPAWKTFHRKYPKSLPGARFKRALSYTHGGKTGMAVGLGLAGAGAMGGSALYRNQERKQPVGKAFGRLHRIRLPQQGRTQASTATSAAQESYDRRKKRRGTITKASPVVRAEMYPNLRPIPDNGYIRLVRTPTDVTRQIASTRMMDRARAEERRPRRRGRLSPTTRYTMGRQYLFATTAEDRR